MAESDPKLIKSGQEESKKLQYLEFVHLAAIRLVFFVSNLYIYAKERSGRLRNGIDSVECVVKTVISPVYDRYHDLPFDLLNLADLKVSELVKLLESHLPESARSVAGEVQRVGVVATAAGLAKSAEPAAERLAVSAWRSLNRLPVFPRVASAVVPAAAGLSERYNGAVSWAAEKGYAFSAFLPLVPTERIARVFDS